VHPIGGDGRHVRASYAVLHAHWVADAHVDLLIEVAWRRRRGERNPFGEHWLPKLEEGGVRLQICPIYVEGALVPDGALRRALELAAAFQDAVRSNGDRVFHVRSQDDLDEVERGDRIGLLLSLEGCEPLGSSAELVETFWELGVRMVGLTWARRNAFADGSGEPSPGGLSRLGEALVDRLLALGAIVDLAHASEQTFADVLARSPGLPVLVSHACCRAVNDTPRNVSDDQLLSLAERDAPIGLMALPSAVDPGRHDLDRFLDHVQHAVSVAGPEHVCFGGDFMAQLVRSGAVVPTPAELAVLPSGLEAGAPVTGFEGPHHYPALAAGLSRRGFDEARMSALLHGNLMRFLRRALPVAA
jgi:membrane dipeptidase